MTELDCTWLHVAKLGAIELTRERQVNMKHLCPICSKPTESGSDAEFPFCSERCRLVDLGNWASERYVVSEPVFEEDDAQNDTFDLQLGGDDPASDSHSPDPECELDSDGGSSGVRSDRDLRQRRSASEFPDKHDSDR